MNFKTLGIILLLLSIFFQLYAETTKDDSSYLEKYLEMSLEELMDVKVVSATKTEEKYLTAPAVMYVVTQEQFREKGYVTLFDLLKDIPGWQFETPHGGWVGQYVRLRGIKAFRQILLLVDGVVQNNINDAEMGRFHTFNLAAVKRVEIITGPASALYGANALLGIVNVISKKPSDINYGEIYINQMSNLGNDSFSLQKTNMTVTGGKQFENGFGFLASVSTVLSNDSGKDYYDPEGNFEKEIEKRGETIFANGFDNRQENYHLKIRLTKDDKFDLGLDFSDISEGIGSMLNAGNYRNDKSLWHTRRFSSFALFNFNVTEQLRLTPKVYHRSDELASDSFFAFNYDKDVDGEIFPAGTPGYNKQRAFKTGADMMLEWTPLPELSLLGGTTFELIQTNNEIRRFKNMMKDDSTIWYEKGEDFEYRDDDGNWQVINLPFNLPQEMVFSNLASFYFQGIYTFDSWLKLIGGARYDRESNGDSAVNPRLGIVTERRALFTKNDHIITKLLYGHSFRSLPYYQRYTYGSYRIELENAKTEKAKTFEMDLIYFPIESLKLNIVGWYNNITDLYLDGVTAVSSKTRDEDGFPNSDFADVETYGIQAGVDYKFEDFLIFSMNYTFTDGKYKNLYFKDDDKNYTVEYDKLFRIAKHTFNASLTYYLKNILSANIKLKFVDDRAASPADYRSGEGNEYTMNENGEEITYVGKGFVPGYTLLDLNIRSFELPGGIFLGFSVTNLFNEGYYDPPRSNSGTSPYYHPQPGRRVMLTFDWKFPE